jgi:orotidine-5'-phosphate decarboxylase
LAVSFRELLGASVARSNSLISVGLDPVIGRLPGITGASSTRQIGDAMVAFNRTIVEATLPFAAAYKPNLAFYLPLGADGVRALIETRELIPADVPVILDAKANDLGNTAQHYAEAFLGTWGFDAVTINPFMGEEGMRPFFERTGKGLFVLARTSNSGSADFQELVVGPGGETLSDRVATRVAAWGDVYPATIGMVVGATWPEQVARLRTLAPEAPILLPGVGAQGGDVEGSVRAGCDAHGGGLIVHAGRSIAFAGEGADAGLAAARAAEALRDEINRCRPVAQVPA